MPAKVRSVVGNLERVGEVEIAPLTRLVEFRADHLPVGIRWESPSAVRVHYSDGRIESLPIPDPTRNIVLGLLAGSLVGLTAMLASKARRQRS
jgi:hypothetical protein